MRKVENAAQPGLTSVVVVTADSGDDVGVCIERVLASTAPVEIVVSDNASADGSIEAVERRWSGEPRLRVLRNGTNLGFGAGCNRGAALARGDALLFLNPDCRIEPDTIERLREALASDPAIGLLGVSIVDAAGKIEPASRRRDPLLRRTFMTMSGLARFESRWPALAGVAMPPSATAAPLEDVDAVSGALMLLPRAMFERLSGFDEGYFLHCEDLDLCRRVRDAGARVVCAAVIRVVHLKGTSSRARPRFVAAHKYRGMWRWFTKFDPAARNPFARGLVWLALKMRIALVAGRSSFSAGD